MALIIFVFVFAACFYVYTWCEFIDSVHIEDIRNSCDTEWESPEEAWIEIYEMTVGEECDIHLGGYAE